MAFVPLNTNNSLLSNYNQVNGLMNEFNVYKNQNFNTPSGVVNMWLTTTAPKGWKICDGSAVSRTQYATLFSVIGTTYGSGDGSTTFNLPNLKGRVPVGRDSAQTEFDTLGETGGAKTHTLTTAEIPAHRHSIRAEYGTASNLTSAPPGQYNQLTTNTGYGFLDNFTQNDGGSGGAHNNLQPYIVINYIIKT